MRDALLAAGAEALKVRPVAHLDEQGRRQKRVISELAMENEILRERIRSMEDFKLFCGGGRRNEPRPAATGRPYGRLSGAQGMGPAAVDVLRAAPAARAASAK